MFDFWGLISLLAIVLAGFWIVVNNKIGNLTKTLSKLEKQLNENQKTIEHLENQLSNLPDNTAQPPPPIPNSALPTQNPIANSQDNLTSAQTARVDDVPALPTESNQPVLSHTPPINDNEGEPAQSDITSTADVSEPSTPTQSNLSAQNTLSAQKQSAQSKQPIQDSRAEPDEHSIPIVTSLLHTFKNWFFGGNLVVRVGAIVLLMGVVLLLRLLSEHFETPIEIKLFAIAAVGLLIAGLGLKLVKKRFTYGITLQGAGLSIAYLTAFFAYQVYHVVPSLSSFAILGVLSVITVALALRQNAFPLALLAFSGAFLAPILTSDNSGKVTVLFGYFLLLNVAIAIIAHFRTWKVLNLLGATVTFGLAYYWGFDSLLDTQIEEQRMALTVITVLHWLLYLFIAIRYAQQVIAYNALFEGHSFKKTSPDHTLSEHQALDNQISESQTLKGQLPPSLDDDIADEHRPILPIDTGLMFATPLLVFGLLNTLVGNITHALTISSALMAAVYLIAGFVFIKNNRQGQQTLIIEGMLALGFGFTALTIALAFDANWIACGWSIQGLALVWFGRRLLRGWTVLFGLALHIMAIGQLLSLFTTYDLSPSNLALSVSAVAWVVAMFVLREFNNPLNQQVDISRKTAYPMFNGVIIDSVTKSWAFGAIWRQSGLVTALTLLGAAWAVFVSLYVVFDTFESLIESFANITVLILLLHLAGYWLLNHYKGWREVSLVSQVGLCLFYLSLLLVLPISYEFSSGFSSWLMFAFNVVAGLLLAQLWIKHWTQTDEAAAFQTTLWLTVAVLLIAEFAYYVLPNSNTIIALLIPSLCLIAITYAVSKDKLSLPAWFDWKAALIGSSYLFLPLLLVWVVMSNWSHDGIVWGMAYIPLLNLFDITVLAILGYGLSLYLLDMSDLEASSSTNLQPKSASNAKTATGLSHLADNTNQKLLLKALGLIAFWALSSLLVRTLHAHAGTPLWDNGAWYSEQVQTGLTILWTLTALIATFMSSRNGKRFWWFMGVSLLALVVIKLVLVDLSQTDAIWRVVSFIGAGSLILLIGYLAPLPPEQNQGMVSDNNEADPNPS